jgi:hypothetical protein
MTSAATTATVVTRLTAAAFFLLTAIYALLVYLPFSYQQFILPNLVPGAFDVRRVASRAERLNLRPAALHCNAARIPAIDPRGSRRGQPVLSSEDGPRALGSPRT